MRAIDFSIMNALILFIDLCRKRAAFSLNKIRKHIVFKTNFMIIKKFTSHESPQEAIENANKGIQEMKKDFSMRLSK